MKIKLPLSLLAAASLALSSAAFAAGAKTYQVTGPVLEVTDSMIAVQKGKDRWDIKGDRYLHHDGYRRRNESRQGRKERRRQPGGFAEAINEERFKSPDCRLVRRFLVAQPSWLWGRQASCLTIWANKQARRPLAPQARSLCYLRPVLPPRIPPRIPRTSCRPIWLLAARIALLAIEVAIRKDAQDS
jgi:hypothetical protein